MSDLIGDSDLVSGPAFARRNDEPPSRVRTAGARLGMDYTPPPRQEAFKAAGRHTALVRFLRRSIVIGSILAVSMIGIAVVFNPFRHLPGAMSIGGVGVNGTKITMDSPKISGVQQGGGAYEVKARQGIQDIRTPGIIDLIGVDAKIGMSDRTTTHVDAQTGTYNNKGDTIMLGGGVRIANTSGYVLNMKSAVIKFRQGIFSSHERLKIDLKGGSVAADNMTITNNGHSIVFDGNILSTFDVPADDGVADGVKAEEPR